MSDTPAPQSSAPAETAPEVPVAQVEATGAPEQPAAEKPKKLGFFARLKQSDDTIASLETANSALTAANSDLQTKLEAAEQRIAEYEALEAEFEAAEKEAAAAAAKAQADAAAAAEAQAKAEAAAAASAESLPAKVAQGVTDAVASLGVPEGDLPAAKDDPPGPGQAGEFAHLKGRDRVVAAINAQFGVS